MVHGRLSLMLGARLIALTPLHHQCEGRPPTFQASRAQRAINSAVASAACLEGRPARYPIYRADSTAVEAPALALHGLMDVVGDRADAGEVLAVGVHQHPEGARDRDFVWQH